MNLWPPFLGAGIRVVHVSPHLNRIDVEMKLRKWNQNYVGTQFGGSLYAMCDPFYMLILMERLGREYIVWDKAATIRFKKPGRGKVKAIFEIDEKTVDDIRLQANQSYKVEPVFTAKVCDESGEVIAEVEKVLYIRRKDRKRE